MKRITQLERDMNTVQADLAVSQEKLEKANKKNADVSTFIEKLKFFPSKNENETLLINGFKG